MHLTDNNENMGSSMEIESSRNTKPDIQQVASTNVKIIKIGWELGLINFYIAKQKFSFNMLKKLIFFFLQSPITLQQQMWNSSKFKVAVLSSILRLRLCKNFFKFDQSKLDLSAQCGRIYLVFDQHSQTCNKRSYLGQTKSSLLKQVTS
jgi:hypothetical protein